jgi:4-hydroxybenzoate polyprenyltransferase
MSLLLSFFRLFWVACCALTLMAQTRLLLNMSMAPGWLDGFVFGGTVFGYYWTHPNRYYRNIALSTGFLGGICFMIPLIASPAMILGQLFALTPVLFWLAYYGFQRPGNAGLRGLPFAKPLTIALTWAWVTVLLPTPPAQWTNLLFLLLGRAAFVFALALAYDLCDTEYDLRHGLRTLTRSLGIDRTFTLIYGSLALGGICIFANQHFNIYDSPKAAALIASLGISAWWLNYLPHKEAWKALQKPLIDGLMVAQFLLVLLADYAFPRT